MARKSKISSIITLLMNPAPVKRTRSPQRRAGCLLFYAQEDLPCWRDHAKTHGPKRMERFLPPSRVSLKQRCSSLLRFFYHIRSLHSNRKQRGWHKAWRERFKDEVEPPVADCFRGFTSNSREQQSGSAWAQLLPNSRQKIYTIDSDLSLTLTLPSYQQKSSSWTPKKPLRHMGVPAPVTKSTGAGVGAGVSDVGG